MSSSVSERATLRASLERWADRLLSMCPIIVAAQEDTTRKKQERELQHMWAAAALEVLSQSRWLAVQRQAVALVDDAAALSALCDRCQVHQPPPDIKRTQNQMSL